MLLSRTILAMDNFHLNSGGRTCLDSQSFTRTALVAAFDDWGGAFHWITRRLGRERGTGCVYIQRLGLLGHDGKAEQADKSRDEPSEFHGGESEWLKKLFKVQMARPKR